MNIKNKVSYLIDVTIYWSSVSLDNFMLNNCYDNIVQFYFRENIYQTLYVHGWVFFFRFYFQHM